MISMEYVVFIIVAFSGYIALATLRTEYFLDYVGLQLSSNAKVCQKYSRIIYIGLMLISLGLVIFGATTFSEFAVQLLFLALLFSIILIRSYKKREYVVEIIVFTNKDGSLPKEHKITNTRKTLFGDCVKATTHADAEEIATAHIFSNPENLKYKDRLIFIWG